MQDIHRQGAQHSTVELERAKQDEYLLPIDVTSMHFIAHHIQWHRSVPLRDSGSAPVA